jgi:excisionase family DNA binding protein
MNQNLLTIDELAKELKVPKSWIYARTRITGANSIPKLKVGKYLRFNLEEVLAWIRKENQSKYYLKS